MRNTPETRAEAQRVLDFIMENPEQHDQTAWWSALSRGSRRVADARDNICDTTLCIAGTAVYLQEGVEGLRERYDAFFRSGPTLPERAADILGLSLDERNNLFLCMDNELARDMLIAVANGDQEKFDALAEAADD